MPTSGGPGEPTPPVPGALSASRAEPRIGEGYPLVPHLIGMMISPLRMLALDSDVCPTPVTYTQVAKTSICRVLLILLGIGA